VERPLEQDDRALKARSKFESFRVESEELKHRAWMAISSRPRHIHGVVVFLKRGNDMDKVLEYRNQELRCRQRAAYDPQQSWRWLAEAEMWEQRAHECRSALLEASNTSGSSDQADTKAA
jgi:hypothetical protein